MHLIYGHANGNALAAQRLCRKDIFMSYVFPNQRVLELFNNLLQHFCKSNLFGTRHQESNRPRSVLTLNIDFKDRSVGANLKLIKHR